MKTPLLLSALMCTVLSGFAQSWQLDSALSSARAHFSVAPFNDLLYFCGGNTGTLLTSTVDVYDPVMGEWSGTEALSSPRNLTASVGTAENLYVAGGLESINLPLTGTATVDIYDGTTWSTHTLTEAFFHAQAVHVGTKVLITGGMTSFTPGTYGVSDVVHIYDEATDMWSTAQLSLARSCIAAASNGTIAVFAGGIYGSGQVSDVVDIYDATNDTWSTATLSEAKGEMAGVYHAGKFYFAGGVLAGNGNSTNVVETFDGVNWNSDDHQLSLARGGLKAAVAGDELFFTGGGDMDAGNWNYIPATMTALVDMYNTGTDTWTTSNMNLNKILHTAVGYGNKVYVAGGVYITTSPPPQLYDELEVWDMTTGIHSYQRRDSPIIYPNPVKSSINIDELDGFTDIQGYEVLDLSGHLLSYSDNISRSIDVSGLKAGAYLLNIWQNNGRSTFRFIKQ